ncbi:hypothetical protein [Parabacteroides distasonis]
MIGEIFKEIGNGTFLYHRKGDEIRLIGVSKKTLEVTRGSLPKP